MNGLMRLRSNYASVTATVALVLALGMGGAYAAEKIGSKQLGKAAVKSKHIKDGQVTTPDLASNVEVNSARSANTANTANTATTADSAQAVATDAVTGAGVANGSLTSLDLANDAITTNKIAQDAVGSSDIAAGAVDGSEILDTAVGSAEIADFSVRSAEINGEAVGASELKGLITAVGTGVSAANNGTAEAEVTCPGNRMVIGGGFAWQDNESNSMIYSAPSETSPETTWVVGGRAEGGSSNTLFAWASCLEV